MATGPSRWADISSLVDNIHEDALFTLRALNVLGPTVRAFNDDGGFNPRDVTQYGPANVRQAAEAEDVTPTAFNPSALTTLTPARYVDQFLLTDQRVASDRQNVQVDAALELGAAFAANVDTNLATHFSSLTGGTIGSAGGTIGWDDIFNARAILHAGGVPGPYYCALHPYQWRYLVNDAVVAGNSIVNAPQFQDALVSTYFTATIIGGVTFAISGHIAVDGSDDAIGAMYSPVALALDIRRPFNIRPERDESREAFELNASMWYAHGVWDAARGVQLVGDASAPS